MASDAGHNEATYALATLTDDNIKRAEYYIKAADQGNLLSMKISGDYYMQLRDCQKAQNYYLMAIKTENSKTNKNISDIKAACYASLGEIYYQGLGGTRDLGLARAYFTKGAAMDNALSTERLIDYIYFGYNGKPEQADAIKHYVQLGDSLTDEAKLRVALYKYKQQAYTEANKYFFQLKNSKVQLPDDIGEIFIMMGEKVYNEDVPAAFYYYSTAYQKGVVKPRQMVRLGYMYLNGKGTSVDDLRAKDAFEKASNLNDQEGTCMLGYMYERGRGVNADKEKAIRLYEKAGRAGYKKAYNNLGTLYASLKEMDKAVKYWEMAANANNKTAIDNLVRYYKNKNNKAKENYWNNRLKQIKGAK
jgi:TPR repeat protein